MAFRYLIYSTGTSYATTIVRESATNNPGVNEASYYSDFVIPEIQPLYLWRVNNVATPSGVLPNTDANISAYDAATAPAPTAEELATMGDVTGATASKIDKVLSVTGKVPIFTVDGNLESSGYDIGQLTGGTDLTFVGSGGTQVFEDGNTITIYSAPPTGSSVTWNDVSAKPSWLSGTTLGAFESGHAHSQYLTADSITGKLDTNVFNGYTGTTQPILNSAVTGVTNLGTGTTLGGISGRNITLKSISVLGGISISGDANNLILSGETNVAAVWGNLTGTLSNQTDLWSQLTGMTAQINSKLNTSVFNTFTGTTLPANYYNKTQINSYSGATDTRLSGIEGDITGLTATKLDNTVFDTYTGTTQPVIDAAVTGATNGLTKSGRNIELGGSLTKNTSIVGTGFDLTVNTKSMVLQAVNGISLIDTDGVGGINLESDAGTISLIGNTNLGVERTKLEINDTQMLITDSRVAPVGLQYAADYSSNFTNESLVSKRYVDAVATGLIPKAAVKAATTVGDGNIDLTGATFTGTIDGYTLLNGDRVLITQQTLAAENGIYEYTLATNDFARSADFDGNPNGEVTDGNLVPITAGDTLYNTIWVLVTPNPIIVGTTPLLFTLFSSPHELIAGTGISIVGNTIAVDGASLDGNSIVWSGNTFNVNPATGTLATALGGKLNVDDFNTFSGTTLPANYYNKTQINSYSGATDTRLAGIESDITYVSGVTEANFEVFTGYTASTQTNQIQLVHTGGTDINTVVATGIEWHSVSHSGDSFTWTGGTDIIINKTADYEVSYHIPHGHSGTNNIRGIASNLVLNGVTILNNTVGTSATARAGIVSSLVLPNTILSLTSGDVLDLIVFRTGLAGVSDTVANGVILIKEKNKLQ